MKKSSRRPRDFGQDMTDGLKVNAVNCARFVGNRTTRMTIFDRTNVAVSHNGKYKKVSIMGEAKYANDHKAEFMNRYKRIINRGTL